MVDLHLGLFGWQTGFTERAVKLAIPRFAGTRRSSSSTYLSENRIEEPRAAKELLIAVGEYLET